MDASQLFENQIPLLKPWIGEEEIQAVAEVLRSGWISQGPKVAEFERLIADYVGVRHGVAANSCTSAMHMMMALKGIGPGDEVIVPSSTCMATANSICHTGATPVFADIEYGTWNLDAASAERAITPRTKGILVVHQIGMPADIDAFVPVVERHGIALLEDAATSFGATYKGKRLGGIHGVTAFSFHPRKMVTTGEGGMLMTNDDALAEAARQMRATGASISDLDRHKAKGKLVQTYSMAGYNYRMTDMQAAIGIVQMTRLEAMLKARADIAARYTALFADIDEVEPPFVPDYAVPSWSSYCIAFRGKAAERRDEILAMLADRGVSARIGIQPLHFEPFFTAQTGRLSMPVTEDAAKRTLFLPIYPGMTEAQIQAVVVAVKACIAG